MTLEEKEETFRAVSQSLFNEKPMVIREFLMFWTPIWVGGLNFTEKKDFLAHVFDSAIVTYPNFAWQKFLRDRDYRSPETKAYFTVTPFVFYNECVRFLQQMLFAFFEMWPVLAIFALVGMVVGIVALCEELSKNAPAVLIALSQAYLKSEIRDETTAFLELERKYLEQLLTRRAATAKKLEKIKKCIEEFRVVDAEEPDPKTKSSQPTSDMGPHEVVYQSPGIANEYESRQSKPVKKET